MTRLAPAFIALALGVLLLVVGTSYLYTHPTHTITVRIDEGGQR